MNRFKDVKNLNKTTTRANKAGSLPKALIKEEG